MKKKEFILGVLMGMALVLALGFTSKIQNIKVHYIPVSFMVDGVEVQADKELFTYNDSLYVPLRFVSQLVDKPITWEGAKQTIWLGQQPPNTFVYLKDLKVLRTQGDAWEVSERWKGKEGQDSLQIAGKKFINGWFQRFWESSSKTREKEFLLNENFISVEGYVGIDDYTINTPNVAICKIYVDDVEMYSAEVGGGQEAVPFKIDLNGKKRIKFYVNTQGPSKDPICVDFAEVKLYYKTVGKQE